MTGKLTTLIAETDRLTVTKRAELRGRIPQRASPAIPLDPHPSRPCPPRRAASMSGSIKARERHRRGRCTQLFWWRVRSPRSPCLPDDPARLRPLGHPQFTPSCRSRYARWSNSRFPVHELRAVCVNFPAGKLAHGGDQVTERGYIGARTVGVGGMRGPCCAGGHPWAGC